MALVIRCNRCPRVVVSLLTFMSQFVGHRRNFALLLAVLWLGSLVGSAVEPVLFRVPLRVAPVEEQVAALPLEVTPWLVPRVLGQNLAERLLNEGFPADVAEALAAALSSTPGDALYRLLPDAGVLASLNPEQRERWHRYLAGHLGNYYSRWPLVLRESDLPAIGTRRGGAEVVAAVRRWGVPTGDGRIRLYDWWALVPALKAAPAREEILIQLLACEVAWAKLPVLSSDPEEIQREAAYWQRGGRFRAIESILQGLSMVRDHARVDLVQVLPRLPRSLLNSFSGDFADPLDPGFRSGLIGSMFFSRDPEDMNMEQTGLSSWLASQCEEIPSGERPVYGDLLVYENPARNPWPYAAVYVADGLVFGRRPTAYGPWALMESTEISQLVPRLGEERPRIYRKKEPRQSMALTYGFPPLPPGLQSPSELRPHPSGPWGRLWSYEVMLPPSAVFLAGLPEPSRVPEWRFRGLTREALAEALAPRELGAELREEVTRLFSRSNLNRDAGEIVVRPPLSLVFAIPPSVRARLYAYLVFPDDPRAYAQQITVQRETAASLPSDLRERAQRLIYPVNGTHMLADYGALFALIPDPVERVAFLQSLSRTPVRIVLLERPSPDEAAGIGAYWDSAGQRNNTAAIASFTAMTDVRYFDIVQLLPVLPRELMNLFGIGVRGEPIASCYWTAMNFSEPEPDNRFMISLTDTRPQVAAVAKTLQNEFVPVASPGVVGDVIAYVDAKEPRNILHLCTYIAADLVFTKNGYGYNSPWCVMTIGDLDALYLAPGKVEKIYFRKREQSE